MQQLQISRGKVALREASTMGKLLYGEMFLDSTNNGKSWEVYVGTSDGTKKVAAEGVLSYIEKITELPTTPIDGGVYYVNGDINVSTDVNASTGIDYPEYKAGDLAIYSSKFGSGTAGWIKVGSGGGSAIETTFDKTNTNYTADTVQTALVEADRNKLAYGGDLVLPTTLSTETTGETLATIFGLNAKAGYYYAITSAITINGVAYEEGDFLAITSSVITNAAALTSADVTFTRIAGGTHDAAKIYISGLVRGNETAKTVYETSDAAITTVKGALESVFTSKADLDPTTKKVLLSELPDTIVGAMEYQGVYSTNGTLPTSANKTSTDTDGGTTTAALVKGDYWLYSGTEWDLGTADTTTGYYKITVDGAEILISSSEGVISSGDTLVFNGSTSTPVWSVMDNTAPFYGVAADSGDELDQKESGTLDGMVTFHGNKRTLVEATTTTAATTVDETSTITSKTDNSITIKSENAALIPADTVTENTIYKEGGKKTLVKTGLVEADDKLTITEKSGIALTGAVDSASASIGTVNLTQNTSQTADIAVALPSKSGTIATTDDISALISGTHFYIPRYNVDTDGNKTIVDSPMEIITSTDSYDGFIYHHTDTQSANIRFRRNSSVAEIVNVFPNYHGYLLNTNSIIDCGEWTDTGLVYGNEGTFDSYLGSTTEDDYVTALKDASSTETTENIVSHIEG